jgi:hypothetical protein
VLAAVTAAASGRPWPSVTRWSLDPGLPRPTGFAPTWSPTLGAYAHGIHAGPRPVQPALLAEQVEHLQMQRVEHTSPGPFLQPTPHGGRRAAAKLADREQPPWRGGTGHVDDGGQAVAIADGTSPAAIRGTGWSWDQRGDQLPQLFRDKLLNKRRGHGQEPCHTSPEERNAV